MPSFKRVIGYASAMAALVFLLKWLEWKYVFTDYSLDLYIGLIAILFTGLGLWVARQLTKTKTIVVEKEVYQSGPINENELRKLDLTTREHEVLQLLSLGHSNAEIADKLCLSISTVKTHVSSLLLKMEVRSRTQALEKAKRLRLTQ